MTQQTAVGYIISQIRQLAFNENTHLGMGDVRVTQGLIDELEEQAKQMEKEKKKHWHSENPKKDGEYICRMDNGYIKMCHYVNGIWYDMWDTGIKGTVKEWMNIPYDNF